LHPSTIISTHTYTCIAAHTLRYLLQATHACCHPRRISRLLQVAKSRYICIYIQCISISISISIYLSLEKRTLRYLLSAAHSRCHFRRICRLLQVTKYRYICIYIPFISIYLYPFLSISIYRAAHAICHLLPAAHTRCHSRRIGRLLHVHSYIY